MATSSALATLTRHAHARARRDGHGYQLLLHAYRELPPHHCKRLGRVVGPAARRAAATRSGNTASSLSPSAAPWRSGRILRPHVRAKRATPPRARQRAQQQCGRCEQEQQASSDRRRGRGMCEGPPPPRRTAPAAAPQAPRYPSCPRPVARDGGQKKQAARAGRHPRCQCAGLRRESAALQHRALSTSRQAAQRDARPRPYPAWRTSWK
jgi:hypothetical protein